MIKVILKGGLGNQMFQYACGKSLSLATEQELILDTTFLKSRLPLSGFTYRDYELNIFNVHERMASFSKSVFVSKYLSYPAFRLIKKLWGSGYVLESFEKQYIYFPELFSISRDNLIIEGYWTSYKYFKAHEKEVREIFDTAKLYDEKYSDIEGEIAGSNAVSINIRRGDYLNKVNANFFTYLGEAYYKSAIDIIRKKVENPKFFVFSYDDPEWIKNVLEFKNDELTIVDNKYIGERFKTYLRLMSLCKHNIISNSTFAFWGAWLNNNLNKCVVCPTSWVKGKTFDIPRGWDSIRNE
ncbi:MAG: alpha-1,2-fucosyltransferase [Patescibacteria group bacterium]